MIVGTLTENGQDVLATEITHAPDLTRNGLIGINDTSPKYKVTIVDGMGIVNAILSNMAGDYDEVKLVSTPLNEQMRIKRTKGKSTSRHIMETNLIQNISLKDFLSNIKAEAELTKYPAAKNTKS